MAWVSSSSSSSKPNVSLKLLIDTKCQSVLFAECSGNICAVFSDVLSSPVSNFVSILQKQETAAGSLANLCKSIEDLNKTKIAAVEVAAAEAYCCYQCTKYRGVLQQGAPLPLPYSDNPHVACSRCYNVMTRKLKYIAPPPQKVARPREGNAVNYMITDDLVVMPLSTLSIMTVLNRFGIKDVSALEERVVELRFEEAVKLLNASLHSKKALTDLFLTLTPPKPIDNGKGKGVKRERSDV